MSSNSYFIIESTGFRDAVINQLQYRKKITATSARIRRLRELESSVLRAKVPHFRIVPFHYFFQIWRKSDFEAGDRRSRRRRAGNEQFQIDPGFAFIDVTVESGGGGDQRWQHTRRRRRRRKRKRWIRATRANRRRNGLEYSAASVDATISIGESRLILRVFIAFD